MLNKKHYERLNLLLKACKGSEIQIINYAPSAVKVTVDGTPFRISTESELVEEIDGGLLRISDKAKELKAKLFEKTS